MYIPLILIDPLDENLDRLMTMQYTRVPVYDDSIDNIIGILNMKDFVIVL